MRGVWGRAPGVPSGRGVSAVKKAGALALAKAATARRGEALVAKTQGGRRRRTT